MFILLPYIQGRIQRARNDIQETLPQGLERFISPSKEGAGVLIRTLQRGDESVEFQRPKIQDLVKVHVECFLENGTKVDSTRDRNQPLVFEVGAKQVIEGLEVAIQRLSVRQLVEVIIPHLYAYGMRGRLPEIPPKSTLVVRLELVAINPAG